MMRNSFCDTVWHAARRLHSRDVAVVLLIVSVGRCAAAQTVTVDQLVTTALQRSPEIVAARARIDGARGRLVQAELRTNPVVVGSHRAQLAGTDYQTMVGVEWPLELGRRAARVNAAREDVEVEALSVRDRERQLAAQVRAQAGTWLAARRTLEVMDEVLRAARQLQGLLDSRVSEGLAPRVEGSIANVELWRLEAERHIAAGEAEAAAIELKRLCGLPPDTPLVVSDSLESLTRSVPATPSPPAVDTALQNRPDIQEAQARVRYADALIEGAKRAGAFDLSLSGGLDRMRVGFPQMGLDAAGRHTPIENVVHSLTVGATLALPWRNRNQGAVAAAQAEQKGAEASLAARQLSLRAELAAAVARETEARRASELYASSIRELARRNTDIMLESYKLGRNSLSDLLTEQRRYLDVEAAYTSALSRVYQARVALRLAQGDLP